MKNDREISNRLLMSYQLILDFYGMQLEDESTGLISRSKNYKSLYKNLCSTSFLFPFLPRGLDSSPWSPMSLSVRLCNNQSPRSLILSTRSLRKPDDEIIVDGSDPIL